MSEFNNLIYTIGFLTTLFGGAWLIGKALESVHKRWTDYRDARDLQRRRDQQASEWSAKSQEERADTRASRLWLLWFDVQVWQRSHPGQPVPDSFTRHEAWQENIEVEVEASEHGLGAADVERLRDARAEANKIVIRFATLNLPAPQMEWLVVRLAGTNSVESMASDSIRLTLPPARIEWDEERRRMASDSIRRYDQP